MTIKTAARSGVLSVTDASFTFDVLRAKTPVLVDFYADWCGACVRVAPVLDELAQEYAGRLLIAKIDVDKHAATAARYRVRGIPSLLLFDHGEEQWRLVNVIRKPAIAGKLDETLAAPSDRQLPRNGG